MWSDIATYCQCRIVGSIPAKEEIFQIVYTHPVQVLDIADSQPGIWVTVGIEVL